MTEPYVGRLQDARKTDGLHLSPRHREKLAALLREHLPGVEVWAYGSRVNGRSHDGSDLDLVLRGPGLQAVPLEQLGDFTDAVRESMLPFLVEARDWTRLPARFHAEVERSYVVLQHGAADTRRAADEWPAVTLGDCAVINDATYSPKEAWPFIHYLDTGNVTDNRIAAIRRLVPGTDTIPSRARRKVQPGDVVYSTVRPDQRHFGLLKDPPDNLLVSTAFAVIRGKAGVAHTDFLYWFLAQRHVVEHLHTIAEHSVSAYPSIRPDDLARLELRLPPLPEQRRIAHVLGTLDDKIALNRRLNATLEDMARTLFKSWFVDFDPVHAKAALKRRAPSPVPELVEGLKGKGTGTAAWTVERARAYLDGIDPEVAALFPDGFEPSELGMIPKGWAVKPLGECYHLTMGQSPPGSTYNGRGEGLPFFQGRADFGFRYPENRKFCTTPTRIAVAGDTLVSIRAPVGDINLAYEECCIGRGVAALRHKSGSSVFTYYGSLAMQEKLQEYDHMGTVFGAINKQQLETLLAIAPPMAIIESFEALAIPLDGRMYWSTGESHSLADSRRVLLSALITGNGRISRVHAGDHHGG